MLHVSVLNYSSSHICSTVFLSLVGEVIFKYRKQQEAESLHEREVPVTILLYTQRPVMTGAWMGFVLLNRACSHDEKDFCWPIYVS